MIRNIKLKPGETMKISCSPSNQPETKSFGPKSEKKSKKPKSLGQNRYKEEIRKQQNNTIVRNSPLSNSGKMRPSKSRFVIPANTGYTDAVISSDDEDETFDSQNQTIPPHTEYVDAWTSSDDEKDLDEMSDFRNPRIQDNSSIGELTSAQRFVIPDFEYTEVQAGEEEEYDDLDELSDFKKTKRFSRSGGKKNKKKTKKKAKRKSKSGKSKKKIRGKKTSGKKTSGKKTSKKK